MKSIPMKRALYFTVFYLEFSAICCAQTQQTKTYTFSLTADQTNVILNHLSELPWKEANPLIQEIVKQVNAQNAPKAVEKPATEPPKE
jgi:hypothetical protein